MGHITFNCELCGKEHTITVSNYNASSIHFCSNSCASKYKHQKHREERGIDISEVIECGCGCGEKMLRWKMNGCHYREYKYILGHNGRVSNSGQFPKGHVYVYKRSDEWRINMSIKQKIRHKENPRSYEEKVKQSCSARNISIEEFKDFVINTLYRQDTKSRDMQKIWRTKVFERDNYTCVMCKETSGNGHRVTLNAHHIKSWKDFPELRDNIDNGITLCKSCHYKIHSKKKGELNGCL
jgi:hypothetical protein